MFDMLIAACLAGAPGECRTTRLPGGETLEACRETARNGVAGFNPQLQVQSFVCVAEGDEPRFNLSEIAPGVFVHKGLHAEPEPGNRGDISNMGFVIGPEAVAVIDTGISHAAGAALLAAIRGETDLPIRYVILTHMHPDHALGTSAFDGEGAEIVGHPRLSDALAARADIYREAMIRLLGPEAETTRIVLPTLSGAEAATLDLGPGRRIRLEAHPTAHTDNDLTVLDEASGTLFAGDLVFDGHLPALDGSLTGWIAVLQSLAERTDVQRIVPGHGPVAIAFPDGIGPTLGYLELLAEQTRAAIAEGKPMLQAIREIAAEAQASWLLFDTFNPRNATAAFKELEWE